MAKRKLESSLNDFVIEHLKKTKCLKTLKLFDETVDSSSASVPLKNYESFICYMKTKSNENENFDDDLGFEINFGAYKPEPRLERKHSPDLRRAKKRFKNDRTEAKIEIPKKFIKKIKALGLREDDAELLYRSKIDWTAVYSDNKIHCAEPFCDFVTEITGDNKVLRNHGQEVHNYGEYPCSNPNCSYVGFSKVRL